MKRSLQEVIELIIFGLIALVIGTGLLWIMGWLLGVLGILFKFIAGIIWVLLRYILPVAIVAGVIFFVVRFLANRNKQEAVVASSPETAPAPVTPEVKTVDTEPQEATAETSSEAVEVEEVPQEEKKNDPKPE